MFNQISSYQFIQAQLNFGSRIPGTQAQTNCVKWLAEQLKEYTPHVTIQETEVKIYNGSLVPCKNIIACFNPEQAKRILLFTHWDTRPWADQDNINPTGQFAGADDGASGTAILLEVARQLNIKKPKVGVDILLTDVEDYYPPAFEEQGRFILSNPHPRPLSEGEGSAPLKPPSPLLPVLKSLSGVYPDYFGGEGFRVRTKSRRLQQPSFENDKWDMKDTFSLGAQYWARNPHVPNYKAKYGIMIDLCGAKGAQFRWEGLSMQAAPHIVNKVWNTANSLGHGNYFINEPAGLTVGDDHTYVNSIAGIPSIAIIGLDKTTKTGFPAHWHTQQDNIDIIDENTLKAVGETLLQVIYSEEAE